MAEDNQSPPTEPTSGITRREALRRGALLGGALAWATPVVQVMGMKPAFAQTASPGCQLRLSFNPGDTVFCVNGPDELCECIVSKDPDTGGEALLALIQCIIELNLQPEDFSLC